MAKKKTSEETSETTELATTNETPPEPEEAVKQQRSGGWLGRLLLGLLRTILVIALGLVSGLAIYLLGSRAIDRFAGTARENEERIAELEEQIEALEETQDDFVREQENLLEDQQDMLDEHDDMLDDITTTFEEQDAQYNDQAATVEDILVLLDDLERASEVQAETLDALTEEMQAMDEGIASTEHLIALNYDIALITAWQEVLKARIRLIENNPGAALDEIQLARDTLQNLRDIAPDELERELDPLIERLDDIAADIESGNAFSVTEDLEVVWHDIAALMNANVEAMSDMLGTLEPADDADTDATPEAEATEQSTDN